MISRLFTGKHFVLHINRNMDRLNKNELKDYPYNIVLSSEYAHPPMSKEELEGLVSFINEFIENY